MQRHVHGSRGEEGVGNDRPEDRFQRQGCEHIQADREDDSAEIHAPPPLHCGRKGSTPETLFVMMDKKFVPLQREPQKRNMLINKHSVASTSQDSLNDKVTGYICEAYDAGRIRMIYIMGDGAEWIKASANEEPQVLHGRTDLPQHSVPACIKARGIFIEDAKSLLKIRIAFRNGADVKKLYLDSFSCSSGSFFTYRKQTEYQCINAPSALMHWYSPICPNCSSSLSLKKAASPHGSRWILSSDTREANRS